MRFGTVGVLVAVAILVLPSSASAAPVYSQSFEGLSAAADGSVLLTGQDGFYIPLVGDLDFKCYTYAGNALGLPANPTGGNNFAGGMSAGGGIYARAQRDLAFIGSDPWTVAFDVAATFNGEVANQNLGSFSIGLAGSAYFINLATWTDLGNPVAWNADMVWYDAAGSQWQEPVPNANFQNLPINHWYRWSTEVRGDTNQILAVSLTDLDTMTTWTYNPPDRYMVNGAAGAGSAPDEFRFFAGGFTGGNTMAFDNVLIQNGDRENIPEPASMVLLGAALAALARKRRRSA